MKTTVDIPDSLMKAIKLRAIQEGKKLNEIMPELLINGLKVKDEQLAKPQIVIDEKSGRPVVTGGKATGKALSPAELAEILNNDEAGYYLPAR